MASKRFRGDAVPVAQVNRITPASPTIGNTFTAVMNGKSITVTATVATVANVTALMTAAWNSSTIAEFAEVTATDSTTYVTLTANTAGRPFTQTSSSADGTGSAGHSFITSTPTASAGPNHWDTASNWSGSGVPATNDDVFIENTSTAILWGLDQNGVTLTSLNIAASYTGTIGLPDINDDGSYFEFRDKYLKISATTLNIGKGDGNGSGRIRINLGTNASTVNIGQASTGVDAGLAAIQIVGSHASNILNITKGTVGLAIEAGTTAQFPVIRVGSEGSPATDAEVRCGVGCTLAGTISQAGGSVTVETNVTTWTKTADSTSTCLGSATITTLTQDGQGDHFWESSGTITTANFRGENAVLNCSRDLRARTLTNGTFSGGGYIYDPNKTMTRTNPISSDLKSFAKHVLSTAPMLLQVT